MSCHLRQDLRRILIDYSTTAGFPLISKLSRQQSGKQKASCFGKLGHSKHLVRQLHYYTYIFMQLNCNSLRQHLDPSITRHFYISNQKCRIQLLCRSEFQYYNLPKLQENNLEYQLKSNLQLLLVRVRKIHSGRHINYLTFSIICSYLSTCMRNNYQKDHQLTLFHILCMKFVLPKQNKNHLSKGSNQLNFFL